MLTSPINPRQPLQPTLTIPARIAQNNTALSKIMDSIHPKSLHAEIIVAHETSLSFAPQEATESLGAIIVPDDIATMTPSLITSLRALACIPLDKSDAVHLAFSQNKSMLELTILNLIKLVMARSPEARHIDIGRDDFGFPMNVQVLAALVLAQLPTHKMDAKDLQTTKLALLRMLSPLLKNPNFQKSALQALSNISTSDTECEGLITVGACRSIVDIIDTAPIDPCASATEAAAVARDEVKARAESQAATKLLTMVARLLCQNIVPDHPGKIIEAINEPSGLLIKTLVDLVGTRTSGSWQNDATRALACIATSIGGFDAIYRHSKEEFGATDLSVIPDWRNPNRGHLTFLQQTAPENRFNTILTRKDSRSARQLYWIRTFSALLAINDLRTQLVPAILFENVMHPHYNLTSSSAHYAIHRVLAEIGVHGQLLTYAVNALATQPDSEITKRILRNVVSQLLHFSSPAHEHPEIIIDAGSIQKLMAFVCDDPITCNNEDQCALEILANVSAHPTGCAAINANKEAARKFINKLQTSQQGDNAATYALILSNLATHSQETLAPQPPRGTTDTPIHPEATAAIAPSTDHPTDTTSTTGAGAITKETLKAKYISFCFWPSLIAAPSIFRPEHTMTQCIQILLQRAGSNPNGASGKTLIFFGLLPTRQISEAAHTPGPTPT